MGQTEILEGNKVISQAIYPENKKKGLTIEAYGLCEYHSSWEILMTAVEWIERLDSDLIDCRITIEQNSTRIYYYSGDSVKYEWLNGGASKKLSVFAGVVRFIKWYNSLKP